MRERPPWDSYGLILARAAASRADCTRSMVGAAILNSRHETIGTGFNGAPAGVPGCASAGACPRGQHYYRGGGVFADWCACGNTWPCPDAVAPNSDYSNCTADHAERNAIRHCRTDDLPGSTLYSTRAPCPSCWTLIRACGIARVITPEGEIK